MASGGRGGRGNLAFKSARNTAPALAEFGEKVGKALGWVAWEAGAGVLEVMGTGSGQANIAAWRLEGQPVMAPALATHVVPAGPCLPLTGTGDLD